MSGIRNTAWLTVNRKRLCLHRKALVVLMAICMALSMFPVSLAFAGETDGDQGVLAGETGVASGLESAAVPVTKGDVETESGATKTQPPATENVPAAPMPNDLDSDSSAAGEGVLPKGNSVGDSVYETDGIKTAAPDPYDEAIPLMRHHGNDIMTLAESYDVVFYNTDNSTELVRVQVENGGYIDASVVPTPLLVTLPVDSDLEWKGKWVDDIGTDTPFDLSQQITASVRLFPLLETKTTASDETEDEYLTVVFIANEKEWQKITVKSGDPCTDRGTPPTGSEFWPSGAVSFRGWSTAPDVFVQFPFATPIDKDTELYAFFSDRYLVKYKDGFDLVIWTQEYLVKEPVSEPEPGTVNPPGENLHLAYWYVEGEYISTGAPKPYVFGQLCSGDMTLVPWFTNEWFVFFVSDGTQVPYQLTGDGLPAVVPVNPTRAGYDFFCWSTEKNGSEPYDFQTPVNDNLFLYAVWKPTAVNYTIVYWIEKPSFPGTPTPGRTGDYTYVCSETASGIAGESTNVSGVSNVAKSSSTEMLYSTFQQADNKTILGNGTTVVNVFSRRNTFTVTFNLNDNSNLTMMEFAGITFQGGSNPRYSISVKYGQDISALWPCEGTASFTRSGYRFTGWTVNYSDINDTGTGSVTWVTKRLVVTADMLPGNPAAVGYTISARWSNNATQKTVEYWIEALPGLPGTVVNGRIYIRDDALSQTYYSLNNAALSAKDIDGVEYVSGNSGANTDYYRFYYNRNEYELSFNTMGGSLISSVPKVKYGQSLSAFWPADPVRATEGVAYTFSGWYLESDYHTLFDFATATMPASPLTLFAKWESKAHTVTFYDDLTLSGKVDQMGVDHNGYVVAGGTPYFGATWVENRGTFTGWYIYIGDTPYTTQFSYDMPITADINLHAVWRVEGYKVTYDIAEGNGTAPVDSDTYHVGQSTRVADGSGFDALPGLVFIGWEETHDNTVSFYYPRSLITLYGDARLVAVYGKITDYVKVIYHSNYPVAAGMQSETVIWYVLMNRSFDLASSSQFAWEGAVIDGWALSPLASVRDYAFGASYSAGSETIDLYAVWKLNEYKIVYAPGDHGKWNLDDETYLCNYGESTPNTATDVTAKASHDAGWVFDGWQPDVAATVSGSATYTAQWTPGSIVVTFDANGGTASVPFSITVVYNSLYGSLGVTSRSGYTFIGWFTDPDAGIQITAGTTVNTADDHTLYAHWQRIEIPVPEVPPVIPPVTPVTKPETYSVTYAPGEHGDFRAQTTTGLAYGVRTPAAPDAIGKPGWQFTGWSPAVSPVVIGSIRYTAQWQQIRLTVTFVDWDDKVLKTELVFYGEDATAPEKPTREGYAFKTWDKAYTNITADTEVHALYTLVISRVSDTDTPLTKSDFYGGYAAWALVNMVLTAICSLLSLFWLVGFFVGHTDEDANEDGSTTTRRKRAWWRVANSVLAVLAISVFLLTEDMRMPMRLIDLWTILHVIILILQVVFAVVFSRRKERKSGDAYKVYSGSSL